MDLQTLREGVAVLDLSGRPLACNARMRQLLDARTDGRAELGALLAKSAALEALLRSGGELKEPVRLADGRLIGASVELAEGLRFLSLSDAAAEEAWRERTIDASRATAVARLSEAMAHDVRNPLNAMAINVEVMSDRLKAVDPTVADSVSKYTKAIRDQIQRVDGIIRRFVDFASPRRAESPTVDLAELVGRAVEACGHDARKQRVKVDAKLNEVRVPGDSRLLSQAVLHLVMHGIAASAGGGRLEIALEPGDSEAVLSFQDAPGTGPDASAPSAITLSAAAEILQLHRGQLSSTEGRGFVARLPRGSR